MILLWTWATIASLWAVIATTLHFRNPLPIPDRGHRIFGVPSEHARAVVVAMLGRLSHLKAQYTFDAGFLHETIMWDGFTGINHMDATARESLKVTATGLSVPVKDPRASAAEAIAELRAAGFEAEVVVEPPDLPPNSLVVVKSDAFNSWELVFRKPLLRLKRPAMRPKAGLSRTAHPPGGAGVA